MIGTSKVPENRITALAAGEADPRRDYVLYWMIANRRVGWNFALQRALDWAQELELPLLVFEPLRAGYPWACDRFHRFVLDGMADNGRRLQSSPAGYYPYVEPVPGAGSGLLRALSAGAAVVVTDDTPAFFYPRMLRSAAGQLAVRAEAVDSFGPLPVRATDTTFATAHSFRRYLQRELPAHLERLPREDPLAGIDIPALEADLAALAPGFSPASPADLEDPALLARLPIDHTVGTVDARGGATAARDLLQDFVHERLADYGERRNHPDQEHTSRLSAYLHFGHISSHEAFATLAAEELWTASRLATDARGARRGWWGMSPGAEAYLDQLVTWRELGANMCHHRDDYDRYESLPDWARATLDEHREDERPHLYSHAQLEAAATHDELWNAAQNQLLTEGRIHNYLRMLWGKKILEWSASPEDALDVMIELNNKYALDGRDPNSYSGIFWVLGRYDRAWGPERPVYGKVRYMSSANAARKLRLKQYLEAYAPQAEREAATSS